MRLGQMMRRRRHFLPLFVRGVRIETVVERFLHGELQHFHGLYGGWSFLNHVSDLTQIESVCSRIHGDVTVWNYGGRKVQVSVRASEALRLYDAGMTLVMSAIEESLPELHDLLRQLERELGLPLGACSAQLIASRRGSGAELHFDQIQGINLQLAGKKTWWVAKNDAVVNPTRSYVPGCEMDPELYSQLHDKRRGLHAPKRMRRIHATPGTAIWLPRGWWHKTRVTDGDSVSLIFNDSSPFWVDRILQVARRQLVKQPEARAYEPSVQTDRSDRTLARILQGLASSLQSTDPAAYYPRPKRPNVNAWQLAPAGVRILSTKCTGASFSMEIDSVRTGRAELEFDNAQKYSLARWLLSRRAQFSGSAARARFRRIAMPVRPPVEGLRLVESTARERR